MRLGVCGVGLKWRGMVVYRQSRRGGGNESILI